MHGLDPATVLALSFLVIRVLDFVHDRVLGIVDKVLQLIPVGLEDCRFGKTLP